MYYLIIFVICFFYLSIETCFGYLGSEKYNLDFSVPIVSLPSLNHNLGNNIVEVSNTIKDEQEFQSIEELLKLGLQELDSQNLNMSISYFHKATQIDPKSLDAWFLKGAALDGLKRYDAAIDAYHQAISINPNMTALWLKAGNDYMSLGNNTNALSYFHKATQIDPKSLDAWFLKGAALDGLKRYDAAIDAYHQAISINPNMTALWLKAGNDYMSLGNNTNALSYFHKATQIDPKSLDAWFLKGAALDGLKRYDAAIDAYHQAISINPNMTALWLKAGNDYMSLGNNTNALSYFHKATQIDPKSLDAWFLKGAALDGLKRYDAAIDAYHQAISINPNMTALWLKAGNDYMSLGNNTNALSYFHKATQIDPKSLDAWFLKGAALDGLKRYDAAIDAYHQAISINPNMTALWLKAGNDYMSLGNNTNALSYFHKATQIDPKSLDAWFLKGSTLLQLKSYLQSIDSVNHAIQINSSFSQSYIIKGQALDQLASQNIDLATGKFLLQGQEYLKQAIASYESARSLVPYNSIPYSYIANDKLLLKEYNQAITYSDGAVARQPESVHFKSYIIKGQAYDALAQDDKKNEEDRLLQAIASYERARSLEPYSSIPYSYIANDKLLLTEFDQAIAYSDGAVARQPDSVHFKSYIIKGQAYDGKALKQKDPETNELSSNGENNIKKAIASYESARSLVPYNSIPYASLAKDHLALKDFDQAIENSEDAVDRKPNSVHFQAYLTQGQAYDGKAGQIKENNENAECVGTCKNQLYNAIEAYKGAIDIEPDSSIPYVNIAKDHLALKDFDQAIENSEDAVDRKPNSVHFQAYLTQGQAYDGKAGQIKENNENAECVGTSPDTGVDTSKAEFYIEKAIEAYENAKDIDPDSSISYIHLANDYLLLEKPNYDSAREVSTIAVSKEQSSKKPNSQILFKAYLSQGKAYDGLADKLPRNINLETNANEYSPSAMSLLDQANTAYNAAITEYNKITNKPSSEKQKELSMIPYLKIAQNYLKSGDNHGVIKYREDLIKLNAPSTILYQAHTLAGYANDAIAYSNLKLKEKPDDLYSEVGKAFLMAAIRAYNDAMNEFYKTSASKSSCEKDRIIGLKLYLQMARDNLYLPNYPEALRLVDDNVLNKDLSSAIKVEAYIIKGQAFDYQLQFEQGQQMYNLASSSYTSCPEISNIYNAIAEHHKGKANNFGRMIIEESKKKSDIERSDVGKLGMKLGIESKSG